MSAFFVRRLAGGAVQIFLVGFLLYALLVPPFESSIQNYHGDPGMSRYPPLEQTAIRQHGLNLAIAMYAFGRPWPLNYIGWLYNPGETQIDRLTFGQNDPILSITSADSGIVTGDFGYSTNLQVGTPVLTALGLHGPGLPLLLSIPIATILFFMSMVVLQRRGRPVVQRRVITENPLRKVWRRAELWPLD